MDNEELNNIQNVDDSTSDLPSPEKSYDSRDNAHNKVAEGMDKLATGLDNGASKLNDLRRRLNNNNNRNNKNGNNKPNRPRNGLNRLNNGLTGLSNKANKVNRGVQKANNVMNTAEDAIEDPLGTATNVAKDKVKDKAKETVGAAADKAKDVAKEAINEGAKAAKGYIKKTIITAILPFIPIIIGVFLVIALIIMLILFFSTLYGSGIVKTSEQTVATNTNGTCSYNVNGKTVTNLKVRLLNCEGNTPVLGESLVDFEDYITGVVYQEVGDAPLEALKVQAIVARSFSLTRPKEMGGAFGLSLKEKDGQWILSLRSCTNDQVFCNADRGCWSDRVGGQTSDSNPGDWPNCTVHSGYDKTKTWSRGPLSKDSKIRKAVEETKGQVLEDSKGKIVHTNFNNSNQQLWAKMANSGKDAFEILTKDYGSGKRISTPNCSSEGDASVSDASLLEIMKWDQKTAWKNLIGKSATENSPSVSNSTMNGRVTTIEVPMRKWTGSGKNPRKDTKKVMQKITINKAIAPIWKAFYEDVYNNAPDFVIGSFDGCYFYRNKTNGNTLSAHAYGVACDINAGTSGNGFGTTSYSKSKWEGLPETREKYQVVYKGSKVVQIAHKYTLTNGSDWSNGGNDAMHFSFIGDKTRDFSIACQGKVSC